MKSKFLSLIVTLAVCVGLVLVPAAVGVSAGDPPDGEATFQLPAEVYVSPDDDFTVSAIVYNPHSLCITTVAMLLMWSPGNLNCTAIDNEMWPNWVGEGIDNTKAGVKYTGGGSNKPTEFLYLNTTNITHCTLNFTAGSSEGIVTVNFTPLTGWGETAILSFGVPKCNWTPDDMQNMTVIIGDPKLEVDVVGNGTVAVDGVTPPGYPDTTTESWSPPAPAVPVVATADLGWNFTGWTGNVSDPDDRSTTVTMDTNDMNMSTLTKTVIANFEALPPDLDVDPNLVEIDAREGGYEDSGTVTVSNIGGKVLHWTVGSPPDLEEGDWWTYFDYYDPWVLSPIYNSSRSPGSFYNNSLQINVTNATPGSDYECSVEFSPAAQRLHWVDDSEENCTVVIYNGSLTLDEYTLDWEELTMNLTAWVPFPEPGNPIQALPAQAVVSYDYDGCHGWPYYMGKNWSYVITKQMSLVVFGNLIPLNATMSPTLYGVVTGQNMMIPTKYQGNLSCWEITHCLWPKNQSTIDATTVKVVYWNETVKSFVLEVDYSFFAQPPPNVRSLLFYSTAPNPPGPADWLTIDPMRGSCGIGPGDTVTLTANTSGLPVGLNVTSFTISAPGSIQEEPVDVNLTVTPSTGIVVTRILPDDAMDYDADYPGESFWVYVNFTSPSTVFDFNSIGVTDFAPAGWLVETDNDWCVPPATYNKSNYNKAEYAWSGGSSGYGASSDFSARYNVTIPATASAGINEWPACREKGDPCGETSNIENYAAWAEYWFGAEGPFESSICGNWTKIVTVPGCVVGETRDVNADLLDTVTVVLYEEPLDANPEDSDSSSLVPVSSLPEDEHMSDTPEDFTTWYENCADDTGEYYQVASKYCFYPVNTSNEDGYYNYKVDAPYLDYINWTTPVLLSAGFRMDFEGDYGLVCRAATMSYAMESINHWLFTPIDEDEIEHPEWKLSSWKAMESIHSWRFPSGCNC